MCREARDWSTCNHSNLLHLGNTYKFTKLFQGIAVWLCERGSFGTKHAIPDGKKEKLTFSQLLSHARPCARSIIYRMEVKCLIKSLSTEEVSEQELPPRSVRFLCRVLFPTSWEQSPKMTAAEPHNRGWGCPWKWRGWSLQWENWGRASWPHNDMVAEPEKKSYVCYCHFL